MEPPRGNALLIFHGHIPKDVTIACFQTRLDITSISLNSFVRETKGTSTFLRIQFAKKLKPRSFHKLSRICMYSMFHRIGRITRYFEWDILVDRTSRNSIDVEEFYYLTILSSLACYVSQLRGPHHTTYALITRKMRSIEFLSSRSEDFSVPSRNGRPPVYVSTTCGCFSCSRVFP